MKVSARLSTDSRVAPTPTIFYEVDDCGTITDPRVRAPTARSDVFGNISPLYIHSMEGLVREIESCAPLACCFSSLADDRLSKIECELEEEEDNELGLSGRRRMAFLAPHLRDDPDTGWQNWIKHKGDLGLATFKQHIQDRLDDDINWGEADYLDDIFNGQSARLHFFSDMKDDIRKALGVVIIEGEHPGSTYNAAELKGDIVRSNRAAQELGPTFRFRAIGKATPVIPVTSSSSATAGRGARS